MEDIFKFYIPNIPFLMFPEIKSLLVSTFKSLASKTFRINSLKDQILKLKSPDRQSFLPVHLKVQFDKLVQADLDPDVLSVGHDFLFRKEIASLESQISTISTAISVLEKEFLVTLDKYLTFADFSPRPSSQEDWDAFCGLYFKQFTDHLKAHFFMHFDRVQSDHQKRKLAKKQKFEEFKNKRSQPLIVTEELLEQKFKQFSISNSKRVRFSIPKTGKRSSGKVRASGKSRQASPKRASRSRTPSRSRSRSRSTTPRPRGGSRANRGKRGSKPRRS
jgi:hypothetical protein